MKGQLSFSRLFSATFFAVAVTAAASGCSIHSVPDAFIDETELSESLHASPRFWEDATEYSDDANLYKVHNVAFEGKPYNDIARLGDNLLLIGQGAYLDVDDIIEEDSEPNYKYSFDIYNPWKNELTASLDHKDIECDRYRIVGDELFLFNDSTHTIFIYDDKLEFVESVDASALSEISDMNFISGTNNSSFYSYDYVHDCILSINRDSFDYVAHPVNMYSITINNITADGKYLLLSGIDKTTLTNSIERISTTSFTADTVIPGDLYGNNSISENGFFAQTSYDNNSWVYHSKNGSDSYYELKDIYSSMVLKDDSIIFLQNTSDDEGNSTTTAYNINPSTGKVKSNFTYSYEQKSTTDFDLLSYNYVYLSECNCMFFLTYTQDCMPELLVWKLESSDDNNPALTRFDSEENLFLWQNLNNSSSGTDSNYGSTITMIPDTKNYDWGNLSPLNERASSLEDKYSVEIYMGEEVPSSIDYFISKPTTDYDTISEGLDTLEDILSCYPDDFFRQLCYGNNRGIRIYLTGPISGNADDVINEPSGFVSNINSYMVMVLDVTYSWDWAYTVNHEISHMIDRKLDFYSQYNSEAVFSEEKWNTLNPTDFTYLNSYEEYEDNTAYDKYPTYFLDSYGTTYGTEDRAELFGTVMDDYINFGQPGEQFAIGTHYYEKMNYYCKCIRDGFDTTNWEKKLPWELTE